MPIETSQENIDALFAKIEVNPKTKIEISIENKTVQCEEITFSFAKESLAARAEMLATMKGKGSKGGGKNGSFKGGDMGGSKEEMRVGREKERFVRIKTAIGVVRKAI